MNIFNKIERGGEGERERGGGRKGVNTENVESMYI